MTRLDIAKAYAKQGIKVFPCDPDTKAPLVKEGFNSATTDAKKISGWWKKHPNALIAGHCDRFTVIDVDDYCVPDLARSVIDSVLCDMRDNKIINDSTMRVRTRNGGTHFYFWGDSDRRINFLPSIDVLGEGGYVILPDQESYVCETSDTPWEVITNQPRVNLKELSKLQFVYEGYVKDIKMIVKAHREANGFVKKRKPTTTVKNPSTKKTKTGVNPAMDKPPKDDAPKGIYSTTSKEYKEADPNEKFLDKNGMLHVDEGMIDSGLINMLFHNKEIQTKLASHIGISVPSKGHKGTVMRSLLPGHIDRNPSFGVRWNQKGTHLICRDFSNYYSDVYQQVDYNIVRLYATMKTKDNVKRLSANQFVTWFLRLMYDAGIINVDHLMQKPSVDYSHLDKYAKDFVEGFILLDALKRTYNGYEGKTVMANSFAFAWCDTLNTHTIAKARRDAIDSGAIAWESNITCSNGGKPTKMLRVRTEAMPQNHSPLESEERMRVNEAIQSNQKSPFVTQRQDSDLNKQMKERYAEGVVTTITLKAGQGMHEKVKNFCEDFGVPNIVGADELKTLIMARYGRAEVNMPRELKDLTYRIPGEEFQLWEEDGILYLRCYSQPIADLRTHYAQIYDDDWFDESDIDQVLIPVSTDVERTLTKEELSKLTLGFSGYIRGFVLDEQELNYYTEDQVELVAMGHNPEEDKE